MASNTQALVQSNIVAGAMHVSQQPTAAAVVFSPCGKLVAWLERVKDRATLKVESRCTGQQVFSRALPRPGKRRAAQDRANKRRTIRWSHDSTWLSLTCVRGVFAADLASGVLKRLSCPAGNVYERCSWAPSALYFAVTQDPPESESLLSLYQISGSELHLAQQVTRPHFQVVVWAADSRVLAIKMFEDICILKVGQQDQLHMPFPALSYKSEIAWSPPSWDQPVLLCISRRGTATFIDCEAAQKGRCEDTLRGERSHNVLWGEHGVVVCTDQHIWLFNVCSSSGRLELEFRLHTKIAHNRAHVLSPDQVHLCVVQLSQEASGKLYGQTLVILNVVSGDQALITLPERLTSDYQPSWTSSGFSLAMPLVMGKRFLYHMVTYVF